MTTAIHRLARRMPYRYRARMEKSQKPSGEPVGLFRVMGVWTLALYGVGDMLGAGIYGLIGKAAGQLGNAIWLAFITSMFAAMLTGLSYASLGSRYPKAGGAAYVVHRAFRNSFLSYVIGLSVMASGLTSMATASRVFSGYFQTLMVPVTSLPIEAIILGFIGVLTLVNFWGMKQSMWLNVLCTLIEISGLIIVIVVGVQYWGSVNYLETPVSNGSTGVPVSLVLQGAVLTFFSFVGFEDMLNVSEEVKNPERVFPLGVIIALALTTILYMAISITAISVIPYQELAVSKSPLVDVVRRAAPGFPSGLFSVISLFAVTNTALLNYIMGSRLVYGMARQKLLPQVLGRIHSQRHTPHVAILVLLVLVLILALSGDISALAKATSTLLLFSFVLVNASLITLKLRANERPGSFEVPLLVPAGGILICGLLLAHAQWAEIRIALVIIATIVGLYFIVRPQSMSDEKIASMD